MYYAHNTPMNLIARQEVDRDASSGFDHGVYLGSNVDRW